MTLHKINGWSQDACQEAEEMSTNISLVVFRIPTIWLWRKPVYSDPLDVLKAA